MRGQQTSKRRREASSADLQSPLRIHVSINLLKGLSQQGVATVAGALAPENVTRKIISPKSSID
jgi:hypothetical protein